jgi:NAD(P)-dependent dehydrogenase (short-subunit alcohol dehydrogenase family)
MEGNTTMELKDKTAVITGGGMGIGQAIALGFAREGARICILDIQMERARETAAQIEEMGRQTIVCEADVTDVSAVDRAVDRIIEKFGRIDILVNNAGANPVLSTIIDLEEDSFEKVLEVNLKGAFLLSKAVAREMIKQGGGGRIINMSSVSGLRARADGTGAYCISKAAMNMLTQVMARERAPYNILVNAIAPGSIKTDFSRVNWTDPERKAQRIREIEIKRFGEPEEVVGLALFLASAAGSFVTGEIIRVDGGQTI